MNISHLVALHEGLWRGRARLAVAKTPEERELRTVWVNQQEREIAKELEFLGIKNEPIEISDDDLLAELTGEKMAIAQEFADGMERKCECAPEFICDTCMTCDPKNCKCGDIA